MAPSPAPSLYVVVSSYVFVPSLRNEMQRVTIGPPSSPLGLGTAGPEGGGDPNERPGCELPIVGVWRAPHRRRERNAPQHTRIQIHRRPILSTLT
eukprot:scaffold995_cov358-Pavlova_lutheri.AAC.20